MVLGIGNILWADEGFRRARVGRASPPLELPDDVLVMDGGTQGLYLVNYLQAATACSFSTRSTTACSPAPLKLVRGEEVPKFTGAKKMSLHQTGFQDVLSAAELLGGILWTTSC